MSNLGFHTVFRMLRERDDLQVERAFLDSNSRTIESDVPISHCSVLWFSVSFELDLVGVVDILLDSGIPVQASRRGDRDPIIIAGGLVPTINPLPLAGIVDGVLRGEAEGILPSFLDVLSSNASNGREHLLSGLSSLPGAYIPCIHGIDRNAVPEVPERVNLAHQIPSHSAIVTSNAEFGETFLVEIARGCRNACKFCGVRSFQGTPRYHSAGKILSLVDTVGGPVSRVGLIATDIGSNPETGTICRSIVESGRKLTISSMEMTVASLDLLKTLARGGQKTLTVAPEAGDEERRRLLGKTISDEKVVETCQNALESEIPNLKLYFLAGTDPITGKGTDAISEADSIVALTKRILRSRGERGSLVVALSPLVPRPGSFFAERSMPPKSHVRNVVSRVRKQLRQFSNVSVRAGSWAQASLEWALSQGDRRWGTVLIEAGRNRARRREILHKAVREVSGSISRQEAR